MVTMLNKNMYKAKRSTDLLSQHLGVTMDTVAQHETEIADIKGNIKSTGDALTKFSGTQTEIMK